MFLRPLIFTFPYFIAFWIPYVWAMMPEMRMVRAARIAVKKEDSKDGGSLEVIFIVGQIGMLAALIFSFIRVGAITPRVPFFWAGVVTLIAGALLRRHCWRVLGEYFTGDVKARADQPVIDRGAYRFVRHPSYTAGILLFIGVGLAWSNWIGFTILMASVIAGYVYRVRVEERALAETIGSPYVEFMKTRKRFVPFVI
jgi:protein-S-isoprenylcysteine O-methyltransferase Ste14